MVLLSVPVGAAAYQASHRQIVDTWMREHGPSIPTWKHALGARGFAEISDEGVLRRTVRTLPTLADVPGAAWVSPDRAWITVFPRFTAGTTEEAPSHSDEIWTSSPRVFSVWHGQALEQVKSRARKRKRHPNTGGAPDLRLADILPREWDPIGESWPEFEQFLSRLDRDPPVRPAAPKTKRPIPPRAGSSRDPREIVF